MREARRGKRGWDLWLAWATAGISVFAVWGCGDDSKQKPKASAVAAECVINSDCDEPLVCVFQQCHEQCVEDRDCPGEARCVAGSRDDVHVCELADTSDATATGGNGGSGGNGATSADAGSGGAATSGGSGGDTDRGSGGSAGGGGSAGSPGSGGTQGSGGTGSGGSAGTGGNDGSGGSAGTGGSGGTAGSGGSGGEYIETDDGYEVAANDDRDHTSPIKSHMSLYLPMDDEDWFHVVAPDDDRAHLIEIVMAQATGSRVWAYAYGAEDNSEIGNYILDTGVTSAFYVSVAPASVTHLRFVPFTAPSRVDIDFTLSPEKDEHEPNDVPESAAPVALNTDITGQLLRGYRSAVDNVADDFYEVSLTAGTATLLMPAGLEGERMAISLRDGYGVYTNIVAATPVGAGGSWDFNVPETATYQIRLAPFSPFSAFASAAEPEYMSGTYTFQVQQ